MRYPLPVTVDLRTARLIKAAQGTMDARLLERDAARMLLSSAKAVRAFCESSDRALANAALNSILDVLFETDGVDAAVRRAIRSHVDLVRRAIKADIG